VLSPTLASAPTDFPALIAGAALLGLPLLLARPSPRRRLCLAVLLGVCLLAGLATEVPPLDQLAAFRLPLLTLAGAGLGCLILSSPYPARVMAVALTLAGSSRVQGAVLLAGAPLLVMGWCWHIEQDATRAPGPENLVVDGPARGAFDETPHVARTDRGSPVTVFDVARHETLAADEAAEAHLIQSRALERRVIRTAAPDRGSNCHGWVYTGGRYWVDGADVERILQENGYQVVSTPQAGDLVIYRDHGRIAHSAVVRVVTNAGFILLESKWSHLGCFLHAPEDYCFPSPCMYYRSSRAGHLLRGLDGEQSEPGEPAASGADVRIGE